MRRPELNKEEIRELIRTEQDRLPALKKAVEDAEQANDLKAYRQAKLVYDDCLEQIVHLENKLNLHGFYSYTEYLDKFAPNKTMTECVWCEQEIDLIGSYHHKGEFFCNKDHANYYDYGTDEPTDEELDSEGE